MVGTIPALVATCLTVPAAGTTPTALAHAVRRPDVVPVTRYGYVWAQLPTVAAYTPYGPRNVNSEGGGNTVRRISRGRYTVRMPRLASLGGVVHVTATGTGGAFCTGAGWGPGTGGALDVHVTCFTPGGRAADSAFTALYVMSEEVGGEFGYVWANQPGAQSYTPYRPRQFNSAGAVSTVRRVGSGAYRVRMPFLGGAGGVGGTVQVTTDNPLPIRCTLVGWAPEGVYLDVDVTCHRGILPADSRFTVTYARGTSLRRGAAVAYAWANEPLALFYAPWAPRRHLSTPGTLTIDGPPSAPYRVNTPGLSLARGNVQVTAADPRAFTCKAVAWGPKVRDGIRVRCLNVFGVPFAARFTVNWLT
jgi:hypothetical protein